MSWFDPSGFASLAKSALKEAQKTFDRALELNDDGGVADRVGVATDSDSGSVCVQNRQSAEDSDRLQPVPDVDERPLDTLSDYQLNSTEGISSCTLVVSNDSSDSIVEIADNLGGCSPGGDDQLPDLDPVIDLNSESGASLRDACAAVTADPFSDHSSIQLTTSRPLSLTRSRNDTGASSGGESTTASSVSACGALGETADCLTSSNSSCHTLIAAEMVAGVREQAPRQDQAKTVATTGECLLYSQHDLSHATEEHLDCSYAGNVDDSGDLLACSVTCDNVTNIVTEPVGTEEYSASEKPADCHSDHSADSQHRVDAECPATATGSGSLNAPSSLSTSRESPETADSPSSESHVMTSSHTSVDGVETAASSDIEVIASPVGETRLETATHQNRLPSVVTASRHTRNLSQTSIASLDCESVKWHAAKIGQLEETLAAREAKLIEHSRRNVLLQEENSNLTSRLELAELKVGQHSSQTEYHVRQLTSSLQQSRTQYQNIVDACRREHVTRQHSNELLAEKDAIIGELRMEGEKLSKEQLKHMNIIKKLRAKEQENGQQMGKLESKVSALEEERNTTRAQLSSIKHKERQASQDQSQLLKRIDVLERQVEDVSRERDDSLSRLHQLEASSEHAEEQLRQLQQRVKDHQSELEEQSVTAQEQLQQQTRLAVVESSRTLVAERDAMAAQAERLSASMQRADDENAAREDALRADIESLQARLSNAEQQREQLAGSLAESSQPLLRQIEQLQQAGRQQRDVWQRSQQQWSEERSQLEHRLQLALSQQQQHTAARAEVAEQQQEVVAARSRINQLLQELQAAESRVEQLVKDGQQSQADRTAELSERQERYRQLESCHTETLTQLEKCTSELDGERLCSRALRSQLVQLTSVQSNVPDVGDSTSQQSSTATGNTPSADAVIQREGSISGGSSSNTPRTSPTPSLSRLSVSTAVVSDLDTSTCTPAWLSEPGSAMLEGMSAQLKLREGELRQARQDCRQLRHDRDRLAAEAADSEEQLQRLLSVSHELQQLRRRYVQLEATHNTLLQVFGEKVEENDELRLDLADVKAMYRQQIDQLLNAAQ